MKAYVASTMRRRRTPSRRDDVRDLASTPPGTVWSLDLSPDMGGLSVDGNAYAAIFAERVTGYLFVVPMKDKTTKSFISALEELLRFLSSHYPGCPSDVSSRTATRLDALPPSRRPCTSAFTPRSSTTG